MPRVAISFAASAVRDLEEIRDWYAGQGVSDIRVRLAAGVFQPVETLADHPDMGRVAPEYGQSFIRELIHPPFRIVYRHDRHRLRIAHAWHSERRCLPVT